MPGRALQGAQVTASVTVRPVRSRCTLTVKYADGSTEGSLKPVTAIGGRASWSWTIPATAGAGRAGVTASCGHAKRVVRNLIVVGEIAPPKVSVTNEGFSIRQRPSSADLSYGLILKNDSDRLDALDISVLINFVDGANRLVGTKTDKISTIGAQSTYALGGYVSFPAASIVTHLETVIQVGGHRPKALILPAQANLRVLPSQFDRGWTGSVEGEIINDQAQLYLQRASLTAVIFDASGSIVGGTTGSASAVLPPGARQFYKLTSGLTAIPIEKAVTAQLSIDPTYSLGAS